MEAQPVQAVSGRFLVTAALLYEPDVVEQLDPRGSKAEPSALDEQQTARFLTNLRRLERRKSDAITIATNEYRVVT
jgi:ABC-type methionine transport system ATPase subunit